MVLSRCAGVEKSKSLHHCRSLFSLFSEQDVEVQEAECTVYRSRGPDQGSNLCPLPWQAG